MTNKKLHFLSFFGSGLEKALGPNLVWTFFFKRNPLSAYCLTACFAVFVFISKDFFCSATNCIVTASILDFLLKLNLLNVFSNFLFFSLIAFWPYLVWLNFLGFLDKSRLKRKSMFILCVFLKKAEKFF